MSAVQIEDRVPCQHAERVPGFKVFCPDHSGPFRFSLQAAQADIDRWADHGCPKVRQHVIRAAYLYPASGVSQFAGGKRRGRPPKVTT